MNRTRLAYDMAMEPRPDDPTYEPAFVSTLLREQVPWLAGAEVTWLDRGWDNDVFRAGERHVVRLSRNVSASLGLARERDALPRLAPHLPIPIPTPVHHGWISGHPQLRFGIYAMLRGVVASDLELTRSDYLKLAPSLGCFLRALHALDPSDYPELPQDTWGLLDPQRRTATTRVCLAQLRSDGSLTREQQEHLVHALDEAESTARCSRTVILHGDLHGGNMLVDAHGMTAVLDWTDLHLGHPATDLSIAYSDLPASSRDSLFEAYGEIAPSTLLWARWRAIAMLTSGLTGCLARDDGPGANYCVRRLRDTATR